MLLAIFYELSTLGATEETMKKDSRGGISLYLWDTQILEDIGNVG